MTTHQYYIGLLSGTSMDGVDCAIVDLADSPTVIATQFTPYSSELHQAIKSLCVPSHNEIEKLGVADVMLGEFLAQNCLSLLARENMQPKDIVAIGNHGQNIRHQPNGKHPFTLQIGDANTIAGQTGITTVSDFRRKDIALGGQGAPLAPSVHYALFHSSTVDRFIVNIGGIANITWLPADSTNIIGFDTGPGNALLDEWVLQHKKFPYDKNGAWANLGNCNNTLLASLLEDPYFQKKHPKSTGREYFNLKWLADYLPTVFTPQDIQATLTMLTAKTISQAIQQLTSAQKEIYICGGGAHNACLVQHLKNALAPYPVRSTQALNIDPDWVEAILFAWLAKQTLHQLPSNIPGVTGANRSSVLGGIYYP